MRTALLLLFITVSGVYGSLLAPWVSENVKLGEDPPSLFPGTGKNQAEPHAIRSVADPDLILATFQEGRFSDGGAYCNGYAVSEDGGFTWRRNLNPRLTQISGGPYFRATDPVGGIALDGTLYLNSLVSVDEAFGLGRLVLQRSRDRGATWTDPITIYTGTNNGLNDRIFPDKNWMVVNDYADAPNAGRIVVTWTNFRTMTEGVNINDYLIMLAYSDNGGDRWSAPVFVTHPGNEFSSVLQYQGSQPVFLPGGGLAIVYHNFLTSALEIAYSPNGGESFPFSAETIHDGYFLYDAPNMRDGMFLPSVNVARETGNIYAAYTSMTSAKGTTGYVYFTRTDRTDGGGSPETRPDWRFRAPVRISGVNPQRVIATPTIAVSPDGSVVTVYFYDNRNGPTQNTMGDFYAVQSLDGGTTWSEPFRLTESTFDLRDSTSTARGYMIGDYFGFAAPQGPDQAGVAVWVDTRSGNADPWSARVGGTATGVLDSWIQANLPNTLVSFADKTREADPDLDGIPLIIEYLTGRSPYASDEELFITDGFSFNMLAAGIDPDNAARVEAGTGRWPVFREELPLQASTVPRGEGFWNTLTWATGGMADHFLVTINNAEKWYLLHPEIPFRWVREHEDSWVWSPWFGYLYTLEDRWLFHLSLGWIYQQGSSLYSSALASYIFPVVDTYPWIVTEHGSWIYVLENTPWIYDLSKATWIKSY